MRFSLSMHPYTLGSVLAVALLVGCSGKSGGGGLPECPSGEVHNGKQCVKVCSHGDDCGRCGACASGVCSAVPCPEAADSVVPNTVHESKSDNFLLRGKLTNTGGRAASSSYAVVPPID